jgi:hypothetical protein
MMHYTSNWLGEPIRERIADDPDEQLDRWREDVAIQDALDALAGEQLQLFPMEAA